MLCSRQVLLSRLYVDEYRSMACHVVFAGDSNHGGTAARFANEDIRDHRAARIFGDDVNSFVVGHFKLGVTGLLLRDQIAPADFFERFRRRLRRRLIRRLCRKAPSPATCRPSWSV